MREYNLVVQAVDVIRSFLNTHESNSTSCLWESDIDGTILKTDWGYFEEGLDEIRDYCERLDADRKDEPTISKMEQVEDEQQIFICPIQNDYEALVEYEPQTETEIAKAIVHKMIDDAVIAEDAYPDLRQKMHDAVDEYEPQTERSEL